ncbi:MAG: hypothetical protein JST38_03380 [Bacteroidetes bacterium]|nr:hypothetical protein [Bacteroidota bacterium]MBS1944709.1 hypothetical protein [Bacteroidota bacterium]
MLNIIAMFGAIAAAIWQSRLIQANKPIHHGRWLTAYVVIGYGSACLIYGPWWGLLALVGMAGMFSMWFRLVLNIERRLPISYMGPEPGIKSASRSKYDLFFWHVGAKLHWPPVLVAIGVEATAAIGIPTIMLFVYP